GSSGVETKRERLRREIRVGRGNIRERQGFAGIDDEVSGDSHHTDVVDVNIVSSQAAVWNQRETFKNAFACRRRKDAITGEGRDRFRWEIEIQCLPTARGDSARWIWHTARRAGNADPFDRSCRATVLTDDCAGAGFADAEADLQRFIRVDIQLDVLI